MILLKVRVSSAKILNQENSGKRGSKMGNKPICNCNAIENVVIRQFSIMKAPTLGDWYLRSYNLKNVIESIINRG